MRIYQSGLLALAFSFVLGVLVTSAHGQTFTVLHTFENTDGANPQAALISDGAGHLYSTTEYGGSSLAGTIFKVDFSGKQTVLYQFQDYPDGARPTAPLTPDGRGNWYGTTYAGGTNCLTYYGTEFYCGTVFNFDSAGRETVVYRFQGSPDGANPNANLIRDSKGNGNWYGTTVFGGDAKCFAPYGCGTVFELNAAGKETVLHTFKGGSDGLSPYGSLVMDSSGNLYGTTAAGGGSNACQSGCGTVFKLNHTAEGWSESVLHRFKGTDGAVSYAGLILDERTGDLYGTTSIGGGKPNACLYLGQATGCGVIFKLNKNTGKFTVMHKFIGGATGAQPYANLIRDKQGNLYGTTLDGGDLNCGEKFGCGTVFKLESAGKITILHAFTGLTDGANPVGGLLLDSRTRSLYGTATIGGDASCQTQEGGGPGCGTVFKITQ